MCLRSSEKIKQKRSKREKLEEEEKVREFILSSFIEILGLVKRASTGNS